MIFIKTYLIVHPNGNKDGYSHTHSQPTDIDNGRDFILEKITPGSF
jgi:hypothetical protein